jgi:hypothetical protein
MRKSSQRKKLLMCGPAPWSLDACITMRASPVRERANLIKHNFF